MTIRLKPGVSLVKISPQILFAIIQAHEVFRDLGEVLTITSVADDSPKRLPNSLHRVGHAVDFRISELRGATAKDAGQRIKLRLTEEFDVVAEGDHIHVEFDPKGGNFYGVQAEAQKTH